ncbi:MAG TPA: alpha/beta hydrolase [Microbacterium sp.]|uniref:alpha/beta hydrolase n=1 Tax=Microbacterium sp. TaxID=51671 RepID=UPI002BAD0D87|nr:alpha/beta hydrolase [Microbacterium sp.]HWI31656.1 alpha/beta hydrolase [Microbacterium sp.]
MTTRLGRIAAVVAIAALALTGCAATPASAPSTSAPGVDVERDITYREVDGQELQLDACLPGDHERPLQTLVLVHGGAFETGDRSTMLGVCEMLAAGGFAAFAVDYRLIPDTYPAQVDDVSAAVAWLREPAQVEAFGLGDQLSLLGSSAGGIIALSAAAAAPVPVTSVVTLSAAGDLTADAAALGHPSAALEKVVLAYLGCKRPEDCAVAGEASPLTVAARLPRTLLVHGSDEIIPIEQAEALDGALDAAGVEHELIVVHGDRHGLQLLNSKTRAAILAFLDSNSSP